MDSRQQAIIDRFTALEDWEARYEELIRMGTMLAPMAASDRDERFLLKGCQSRVWLKPSLEAGKVSFSADSDALIVKGIVALVLEVYNDRKPAELLTLKPDFVEAIGLGAHLSPTRANGLAAMLKQIKLYALALQAAGGTA
jgi:cysteine desulfuration protein SufE